MNDHISEFKTTLLVSTNAVGVGIMTILTDHYLSLDDIWKGIIILIVAIAFEAITGWRAMYLKVKSGEIVIDKKKSFSSQIGLGELINKTIAYTTGIILSALIADWLEHPSFSIWKLPEMSIIASVTLVFLLIEVIQIYFNFKNMGIDIGKMVKDFFKELWEVLKVVKNN